MASRINWYFDSLTPGLAAFDAKVERALAATMEAESPRVESYMKVNAPWTDRTTNARNSLNAQAFHGPKIHGITAAHGVPYGIFLEVSNAGIYGIILDTIQVMGREVMTNLRGLLAKI